jgi:hypothetical protein
MNRHTERSLVYEAANEGRENRKLRYRSAFGDVSNTGECRIMDERDVCLSYE